MIIKTTLLGFILSCFMIPFLMGNSLARDLEGACYDEYNTQVAYCEKTYSTVKYDIWGNYIGESNITIGKRNECKARALESRNDCIRRAQSREYEENTQQGTGSQFQRNYEDTTTSSPSSSTNSPIYKWKDKDGVVHITNDITSIPSKYLDQVKQWTGKKETKPTEDRNNTESKSTNKETN